MPNGNISGYYSFDDFDEIILNDELQTLFCNHNNLNELKLSHNLLNLFCWGNNIKELYLNNRLITLETDIYTNVENINNPHLEILFS